MSCDYVSLLYTTARTSGPHPDNSLDVSSHSLADPNINNEVDMEEFNAPSSNRGEDILQSDSGSETEYDYDN